MNLLTFLVVVEEGVVVYSSSIRPSINSSVVVLLFCVGSAVSPRKHLLGVGWHRSLDWRRSYLCGQL